MMACKMTAKMRVVKSRARAARNRRERRRRFAHAPSCPPSRVPNVSYDGSMNDDELWALIATIDRQQICADDEAALAPLINAHEKLARLELEAFEDTPAQKLHALAIDVVTVAVVGSTCASPGGEICPLAS
jgi:hypothetical protein